MESGLPRELIGPPVRVVVIRRHHEVLRNTFASRAKCLAHSMLSAKASNHVRAAARSGLVVSSHSGLWEHDRVDDRRRGGGSEIVPHWLVRRRSLPLSYEESSEVVTNLGGVGRGLRIHTKRWWVPPRRMRRGCVALSLQLILRPSSKLFEEFLGPQFEVRSGRTEVGEIGESMQGAMSLSTKPIEVPPGGAGSLLEVELLILCQQPPTRIPPLHRPCSASRSRFAYRFVPLERFEVSSRYCVTIIERDIVV